MSGGQRPADALRLHAEDPVIVLLRDAAAGDRILWQGGGDQGEIVLAEAVPLGHKASLVPLAAGTTIRKYGAAIGAATAAIGAGRHVHVHNLVSLRAKGAA